MAEVQAINLDPTRYFNSYNLTNPYAVPVVTKALYDQGRISGLDAIALNMNPMMAPLIAPGIKMNPPLQADTVNFTANSEQITPEEQKKEKSSMGKILFGAGAIALTILAIVNHKKIGEFLGVIKKEGTQVADDVAKNEKSLPIVNKKEGTQVVDDIAHSKELMKEKFLDETIAEIEQIIKTDSNPVNKLYEISKKLDKEFTPESIQKSNIIKTFIVEKFGDNLQTSNPRLLKKLVGFAQDFYMSNGETQAAADLAKKFNLA